MNVREFLTVWLVVLVTIASFAVVCIVLAWLGRFGWWAPCSVVAFALSGYIAWVLVTE